MARVRYFEFTGNYIWLTIWFIFFFPVAPFYFVLKLAIVEADVDDPKAALNNLHNRPWHHRGWKSSS